MTVDLRGFLRSSITSRRSRPRFLPKAAMRPRMLSRALRPGVIFASLATTDWLFSRLLVSEANASTVLFLDASYWSRKVETGLCEQTYSSKSPPAEGSLASPDAFPGIASLRDFCQHRDLGFSSQPCVRRCSFGALRLISAVTGFSLVFS